MLAMMFLGIFGILALGFYETTNCATMVVNNDVEAARTLCAAESGLHFMVYQLSTINVPPGSTGDTMLTEVYNQLSVQMNGTGNLKAAGIELSGGAIYVPGHDKYIALDNDGSQFRAVISQLAPGRLRVQVRGSHGALTSLARAVQLDLTIKPNGSSILGYGVASKGPFSLSSSYIKGVPDALRGSVLTTSSSSTPISLSGGSIISGKVVMTNPTGQVVGSGSIDGISNPSKWDQVVTTGAAMPEFPTADPTPFINYLVGKETIISSNQSKVTLSNIRIKAGTNPKFSGCTINGVILIEAPNKITFSSGSTKITGVIVTDKPNEPTTTNSITFSGGGTVLGPENLPASYGALRTMTGTAILAPNFSLNFSGGSASIGGSIMAKTALFSGGSGGTVDGSMILMSTSTTVMSTSFSGGSTLIIGTARSGVPAGMVFSGGVSPEAASYEEIPATGL
jgi:hypothetical protein